MTTTTLPSRSGSRRRNDDRTWWWITTRSKSSMVRMLVLGSLLNLPFFIPCTAVAYQHQATTHQCRLCASDSQVPVHPDRVLKIQPDDPPITCQDVYDHLGTVTDPNDCQALRALVTPFCECDTPRPCSVCSSSPPDQHRPHLLNPYDTVTWVDPTTTSTTNMTNDTSSSLPCWYFLDIPNVTDPSTDCALLLDLAAPVCQCSTSSDSPVPTVPLTLAPTVAPANSNTNNNASMAPTYSEPCKWRCNNDNNNKASEDDTNSHNRTRLVTIAGTVISCGQLFDWADQNLLSPDVCTAVQTACVSCSTASSPNITATITTSTSTSPTIAPMTLPPTSGDDNDALGGGTGRDVTVSKATRIRTVMGTVVWVLLLWLGSSLVETNAC